MRRFIEIILDHRIKVLALLFLITAAFGAMASQGVIASSIGGLFFGNEHKEYLKYKKLIRQFYSDEMFLVGIEEAHLLSPESIKRLEKALAKVKKIPDVRRVQSILSATRISFRGGKPVPQTYAKWLSEHPEKRDQAIKELTDKKSLYRDLLISKEGKHTAVLIELKPDDKRSAERGPEVVGEVLQIFRESGFESKKLHRHGMMATVAEIMDQTYLNFTVLSPLVCLSLILVLYLIFKRIWPISITVGVSLIASLWTVGFAVILDKDINVFISASPMLILIIATSDVIHLCNAYLIEFSNIRDQREAILTSCSEVGMACVMTSITTFVGFVSLTFIPIPAFQQAGIVLGFGVSIALLLAVTLTPILFSFMREPKVWTEETSAGHKILGRVLGGIERLITHRPWSVIFFFIFLSGLSAYGFSQLTIETDLNKRLSYNNSLRKDERYFKKHFVSSNIVTLVVETGKKGGILNPEFFQKALEFQQKLEKLPAVDRTLSVATLVGEMEKMANPLGTMPLTKERLSLYFQWMEKVSGKDLSRLVDLERTTMLYEIRLKKSGMRTIHSYGHKLQGLGERDFGKMARVEATGIEVLFGQFLNDVFVGQRNGVIFAILTIGFLMILWLRSVSVGLWSMIPNILPLVAVAALAAMIWDQVDSDTLIVLIIAIGIGVDDTIHFMVRLRYESESTENPITALKGAFHYTGRAIIITSVILMAGFLPFALSDYFTMFMLGTLLPFTLFIAMITNILLVPAMAQVGIIRFKAKRMELGKK